MDIQLRLKKQESLQNSSEGIGKRHYSARINVNSIVLESWRQRMSETFLYIIEHNDYAVKYHYMHLGKSYNIYCYGQHAGNCSRQVT